jgi:hypothetical protein
VGLTGAPIVVCHWAAGTLANGKVYVAVSSMAMALGKDGVMLGLFAGVDIPKGEIVTSYGGMQHRLALPPARLTPRCDD